ncbi:MAG: hypothetical protein Ct9H300mP16_17850 [Pseudomonadota bacterium]|nr:MAG: hypothetical protein Ct9H300mP16_17850 [Pseudomonadota bacterium]
MRIRKREISAGLCAVGPSRVLNGTRGDTPKSGGTLIMTLGATPRHLNPAVQSGITTGAPGAQLFATLLRFDDQWNPHPYLAKSWQVSDDSLTVTFDLVEGQPSMTVHPSRQRMLLFQSRPSRPIIHLKRCLPRSTRSKHRMRAPQCSSSPSRIPPAAGFVITTGVDYSRARVR